MRLYFIKDTLKLYTCSLGGLNFDVRIPLVTFLAALVFNIYRSLVCGSSAAAGDCSLFPLNLFDPSSQVSTAGQSKLVVVTLLSESNVSAGPAFRAGCSLRSCLLAGYRPRTGAGAPAPHRGSMTQRRGPRGRGAADHRTIAPRSRYRRGWAR